MPCIELTPIEKFTKIFLCVSMISALPISVTLLFFIYKETINVRFNAKLFLFYAKISLCPAILFLSFCVFETFCIIYEGSVKSEIYVLCFIAVYAPLLIWNLWLNIEFIRILKCYISEEVQSEVAESALLDGGSLVKKVQAIKKTQN